jgi:hypothetical protein
MNAFIMFATVAVVAADLPQCGKCVAGAGQCMTLAGVCYPYVCATALDPKTGKCPQLTNVCPCVTNYCDGTKDDGKKACCGDGCPTHRDLTLASTAGPAFPAEYTCDSFYILNGTKYSKTVYTKTNVAEAEVGVGNHEIKINAGMKSYQISPTWCTPGTLYSKITTEPAVSPAYTQMAAATMDGEACDVVGENDQWVDVAIYYKKGSWEPVAKFDAEQQKEGMKDGLIHYVNCKSGVNASAFVIPASCNK